MPDKPWLFQKGHKKVGGRKKGKLNANTEARQRTETEARKALEALGVTAAILDDLSPVSIMQYIMVARFREGDHVGALAAATSVAPYVHPKLAMTDMRITNSYNERSTDELVAEREELAAKMLAAQQIEGIAVELNTEQPEPAQLDLLDQLDQSTSSDDD